MIFKFLINFYTKKTLKSFSLTSEQSLMHFDYYFLKIAQKKKYVILQMLQCLKKFILKTFFPLCAFKV